MQRTLGQHVAARLTQAGVHRIFGVPGDYNLALLDELLKEESLDATWCCNELNAGYAADGYARARDGLGCVVVTFTVGGLSAINAIAGACSENIPLVVIVGGPNSNDFCANRQLHHTTGDRFFFMQELECYRHSKPVYICICSNLASREHKSFCRPPIPISLPTKASNPSALEAAVKASADFINSSKTPVLVAGPLMRCIPNASHQFLKLVEKIGCAFAVMPAAKGLLPESHPGFVGTYWGPVSFPALCRELVESSDCYLFVGASWNDYATAGYQLEIDEENMVSVDSLVRRVVVCGAKDGQAFGCVETAEFLDTLAERLRYNDASLQNFKRLLSTPSRNGKMISDDNPLDANALYSLLEESLTKDTVLITDPGDSLFNLQKIRLPDGCRYEWAQQYGSIGWSVGATLGVSSAFSDSTTHRAVAVIGDGSFQMTAVEVSTMLRYELNPIVIILNNSTYGIEEMIHRGPKRNNYNDLNAWDYVKLAESFDHNKGRVYAVRASTKRDFEEALKAASSEEFKSKMVFIEAILDPEDCSEEMQLYGALVAQANQRPPRCST